jgi:hypothetical protein
MVWVTDKKVNFVDRSIIESIVLAGQMNRQQHFQLSSALLADPTMAEEERCQINRVFDYIQTGRVRLVD